MKLKAFEYFGVLPFLFYVVLGGVMYEIMMYIVNTTNLQNEIAVMTGSWLFLIPSGFVFGLTLVATFVRFTPQIRKTFGFMLGALLPLLWSHHSKPVFLASFGVGVLLGLATVTREKRQLKLIKDFSPVPFLLLLIPPISEVVLAVQKGNYTQNIDVFLGYIGLIVVLFIDVILLRKTSSHALRDENTSEEVTIFLGPRQSGKTILSLGFYYELVTGKRGTYTGSFVSEESVPLKLSDLYGIFRRKGFAGVMGTQMGWVAIHTFRLKRAPIEKALFGLRDIKLEITDYAGEILWKLESVFRDPHRYDDLVREIKDDINADFKTFMKAIRYPENASLEAKQRIAKSIQKKILEDVQNMRFDFRKYRSSVYWEMIPESIRTNLAIAHAISSILRANKIVPLIDGEGILYEMYQRDIEFRNNIDDLKKDNPHLYKFIIETINRRNSINQSITEAKDIPPEFRKTMLDAQLWAYTSILLRFKELKKDGDFAFLITKADLIAAVFEPNLLNIDLRKIKKRVKEVLMRTVAFANLVQNLVSEKQIDKRLMFSVILSPADLRKIDPESAEELQDEILVRGLRDLIDWVRKTPGLRKVKEVLLP